MTYDPSRVASSFYQGLSSGQDRAAKGLNMDLVRKQMNSMDAKKLKRTRIDELIGKGLSGDSRVSVELGGLGQEGLSAMMGLQKYSQGLQSAEDNKTLEGQKIAGEQVAKAIPYALNVSDETEWQKEALPYLGDAFIRSGGDPALIQKISNMPMRQAQQVIGQMWDDVVPKQGKPKSASLSTYQNTKTGETLTIDKNDPTSFNQIKNSGDWVPAASRQETGVAGEFSSGSKSEKKAVRQEIIKREESTDNLISYIDDIQKIIIDSPDANALGGTLAKVGGNLLADVRSVARTFTGEARKDAERILSDNVGDYRDDLKKMGVENARMQSAIIGLAYQAALQVNQRVTDADFKAALKEVGGSHSDPEAFKAVISDYKGRAIKRYESSYKSRKRMYPSMNMGEMRDFGGSDVKPNYGSMSLEDLKGIDTQSLSQADGEAAFKRWEELNAR